MKLKNHDATSIKKIIEMHNAYHVNPKTVSMLTQLQCSIHLDPWFSFAGHLAISSKVVYISAPQKNFLYQQNGGTNILPSYPKWKHPVE